MIEGELGRFGDKRLACVGGALLASMQRKRTLCLHRLAENRDQSIQFGSFLANPAVTAHEMLATAGRQTTSPPALRVRVAIPYTPANPMTTPATPPTMTMASRLSPELDEEYLGLLGSVMIGETTVLRPRAVTRAAK